MRPENSIRLISVFVCTLLFTCLLVSCQPSNNGTNTATGGAGTKHKLAFVTNKASDFWTIARKGTEKAAKDIPNIEVEFRIPSDGTAAEQNSIFPLRNAADHELRINVVNRPATFADMALCGVALGSLKADRCAALIAVVHHLA